MASESIYRENILDHYKHPRNHGKIANADSEARDLNPFCGDDITMYLKIGGKRIKDIKFDGTACAICTSSASMLTEEVKGKTVEEARLFDKERLLSIIGIEPGPTRLKCALLPLKVLKLAVYKHIGKKISEEDENLV